MHHKVFLAFAAAFAGGCYAKVTATEVVSSLDTITQNILDLEVQVNSISKENATDLTALQIIVDNYRDLVIIKESDLVEASKNAPAFPSSEQEPICTSITKSSEQHVLLLDTLVAKYKTFDYLFHSLGAALLKQDEAQTDAMALTLFDLAPDCKKATVEELGEKFTTAIKKYQKEEEEL